MKPNNDTTIQVQGLSKTFRVPQKAPGFAASVKSIFRRQWLEKTAVSNVSFSANRGEIVGLVGSNGAGKTTLVKMLAGIVFPTHGEVTIIGHRPWKRENDFRRQIALIMGQKAQLWWDLPAADCFQLLKEIYEIPAGHFLQNLDYLVRSLGVEKLMTTPVRRLSLGERMKMELIAALLHSPKVVFLDEPTIGLDLNAQRALRTFLLEYRKQHQPTMILTSHYMEDIEKLCERIIIMREGNLVFDGPLKKITTTFASAKIISATWEESRAVNAETLPKELGELIESGEHHLKLRCPRHRVNEAATFILSRFHAQDLSVAEDDIGTIIASLLTGEKSLHSPHSDHPLQE